MKTAIILGATGLVGSTVLKKLLKDKRYEKIKLFSRNPVGIDNPKIEEHLTDLFELEKEWEAFIADEVYCCVGSTKKKTPDEDTYRKVDYGIPVTAARLAKANKINTFLVVSALGADPGSKLFYNRTKGEMERDVLEHRVPHTYIFQPSLIGGERKEKRIMEDVAKKAMKAGNYLLRGPLKKYRSIHPEAIAKAMIYVANNSYSATRIESKEIQEIATAPR